MLLLLLFCTFLFNFILIWYVFFPSPLLVAFLATVRHFEMWWNKNMTSYCGKTNTTNVFLTSFFLCLSNGEQLHLISSARFGVPRNENVFFAQNLLITIKNVYRYSIDMRENIETSMRRRNGKPSNHTGFVSWCCFIPLS